MILLIPVIIVLINLCIRPFRLFCYHMLPMDYTVCRNHTNHNIFLRNRENHDDDVSSVVLSAIVFNFYKFSSCDLKYAMPLSTLPEYILVQCSKKSVQFCGFVWKHFLTQQVRRLQLSIYISDSLHYMQPMLPFACCGDVQYYENIQQVKEYTMYAYIYILLVKEKCHKTLNITQSRWMYNFDIKAACCIRRERTNKAIQMTHNVIRNQKLRSNYTYSVEYMLTITKLINNIIWGSYICYKVNLVHKYKVNFVII